MNFSNYSTLASASKRSARIGPLHLCSAADAAGAQEAGAPTARHRHRQGARDHQSHRHLDALGLGMLVFVLAYFVVVFATFAFSDQQIARLICTNEVNGWITTECFEGTLAPIDHAFAVIDAIFLTLFLIEIAVKVFALGKGYLQDVLNGADSFIIAISIIMTYLFLAAPDMMNDASSAATLLPFFKIVRLLRVVLVMTRLQRSRERYRRMKMVGLAAPVEKVFEIIGDLRAREHPSGGRQSLGVDHGSNCEGGAV